MISNKRVGWLLFITSTVVMLSAASSSLTVPIRTYLRRRSSQDSYLKTKSTKKFKYNRFSSTQKYEEYGNLVTPSSADFVSNKWKSFVSINDDDDRSDSKSNSDMDDDDMSCEIHVVNEYSKIVTFCWISEEGQLYHHYPISDGSIKDGSVRNSHTEYTRAGHSFVGFLMSRGDVTPKTLSEIRKESFVFLYQPTRPKSRHILRIKTSDGAKTSIELVCKPIEAREVIDTTSKAYYLAELAGFKFHCEPGVFDCNASLEETLVFDLSAVCSLLPPNVLKRLQKDVSFWLNTSITYGEKANPIVDRSCAYHAVNGQDWLRRNGLSEEKAGCIEICSAEDYLKSRDYWGVGGLILHELMHCVHNRYGIGGYDCDIIQNAYNQAMEDNLYDCVAVHGPQGKNGSKIKAYACANCMEFFAELSVAYLWNIDSITEYNKWFPHNRAQLKEHDIRTYEALEFFWNDVDNRLAD